MGRELERHEAIERAQRCGLTYEDAVAVRRIALTLHRWFELECGDSNDYGSWAIEREEETEKPYMIHHHYGHRVCGASVKAHVHRVPIADKETGARKRLDRIMSRYPNLRAYIQTDPRGGTIYLCKPEDATNSLYTRGVFIA